MHSGKYLVQTATLVNRSPVLTRPQTSFETALFQYNANVGRALFNPFPYDFYFKSGSLLKRHFNKEERVRESQAFNWGTKKSHKSPSKKISTASRPSKKHTQAKVESVASVSIPPEDLDMELMSRSTEADRINDTKSLNRNGHRNLYLLIKKSNQWRLPGALGGLRNGELLHEAARRELHEECGINMDVWLVGRRPIGFMSAPLPLDLGLQQYSGSKIFIFKAHVLAGQVDPAIAKMEDYAWLTKAEIKQTVTPDYWNSIHETLSDY